MIELTSKYTGEAFLVNVLQISMVVDGQGGICTVDLVGHDRSTAVNEDYETVKRFIIQTGTGIAGQEKA